MTTGRFRPISLNLRGDGLIRQAVRNSALCLENRECVDNLQTSPVILKDKQKTTIKAAMMSCLIDSPIIQPVGLPSACRGSSFSLHPTPENDWSWLREALGQQHWPITFRWAVMSTFSDEPRRRGPRIELQMSPAATVVE